MVHSDRPKRAYLNPPPDSRIRPPWCGFTTGGDCSIRPVGYTGGVVRGVMRSGVGKPVLDRVPSPEDILYTLYRLLDY